MLNIDKLCEVQKFIKSEYYAFNGLCGVDEDKMLITEKAFVNMCEQKGLDFEFEDFDETYDEAIAEYNGVKIIALCKK